MLSDLLRPPRPGAATALVVTPEDDPRGVGDATFVEAGRRRRRHGAGLAFDREQLEQAGWQTTLEYRENHVRRRDRRLEHLETVWRAEAERTLDDGSTLVITATAHAAATAWSALRREADLVACRASPTSREAWRDDATRAPQRPTRRAGTRQHASH